MALLLSGMLNNGEQAYAHNLDVLRLLLSRAHVYAQIAAVACKQKDYAAHCNETGAALEAHVRRVYGSSLRALEIVDPPFVREAALHKMGTKGDHDAGVRNRIYRWRWARLWTLLVHNSPSPGPAAYRWVCWLRPDSFVRLLHEPASHRVLENFAPRELEVKVVPGCTHREYSFFNWSTQACTH